MRRTFLERRSQVHERQADDPLSEYDPHENNHHSYDFGHHSCMHAAVCGWFDLYNRNQEAYRREGLKLPTEPFTNLAHRKDLTASGNGMRENDDNCLTTGHVSQEARLLNRSWQRTTLRDPAFD